MRRHLTILLLCMPALALAQNPRHVIVTHPRMWLNNTIADTWEPAKTRLNAIVQRICGNAACTVAGSSAQAYSDFQQLMSQYTGGSTPDIYDYTDDGSLAWLQAYGLAYQIYHILGNDTKANTYAQALWNTYQNRLSVQVVSVVSIVTDGSGYGTITFTSDPGTAFDPGNKFAIWGATPDSFNSGGDYGKTSLAHSGAVVTASGFPASVTANNSGILAVPANAYGCCWFGTFQNGDNGWALAQSAFFYDWCYDWLVANGHDQYVRENIKAGYWSSTLTRGSSGFNSTIREADFHNFASWPESGIMEAGLALWGDDPLGATIVNEGAGYLFEGITVTPNEDNPGESFTYNIKASVDAMTGGAMNWEGSQYHRTGPLRFVRMIEDYDTATGRLNNLWGAQFSTAKNVSWYTIYTYNGLNPEVPFGDTNAQNGITGRDNMLMSIVNDRYPDPHFVWMMNNDCSDTWNAGSSPGGWVGLVYKLVFYPYLGANAPGSHDLTDLPTGAAFGPDVVMRTGWGATDSVWWFSGGLPGTYHRASNAGDFGLFKNTSLISKASYLLDGAYTWTHEAISSNTLQIFDPGNCWTENGTCGKEYYGNAAIVDGGQRDTGREFNPPFGAGYNQNKIWSGTSLSTLPYSEVQTIPPVNFKAWTGLEYAKVDMSKAYTNNYGSGTNSTANPTANVTANSAGAVTRDIAHFQPTSGGIDTMVIFDRVKAANASFQKSNVIHTVGPVQTYSGSWTTQPAGIHTASATTALRADNGTARVYIQPLLPATANTRVVGGHTWAPIAIVNATASTDAVFTTATPHGLTVGEGIAIATGTAYNPWIYLDIKSGYANCTVATTPTSTTFTVLVKRSDYEGGFNSSALPAWASVFGASGTVDPTGACTQGYVYFNTSTHIPWVCNPTWVSAAEWNEHYDSPVIAYHSIGGYEGWADQYGAAGSAGYNSWSTAYVAQETLPTPTIMPQWAAQIQPASSSLTDYFLTVVTPTATSVSTPPTTTLISSSGWYGAQIVDTAATYVAMFPAAATAQTGAAYTLSASGTVNHLVSGLAAGGYTVSQAGTSIGSVTAGSDGSVSFASTGGGTFTVSSGTGGGSSPVSISGKVSISGSAK